MTNPTSTPDAPAPDLGQGLPMSKRKYMDLCDRQSLAFLESCVRTPSVGMRPIDIALIKIFIRRKLGRQTSTQRRAA